ncbi:prolipoprotein diacylglyceryl transferase [Desulfobotulus sp. H1]|uniref:Phosphatidylglycerol--prolipoprotein diacylglyceryl transferase n=1 Tax=Desulfobotulus pelophilus TaxID=2823377 RepID=A0ABT3N826_9BACT|nr:prolipoprotein diacylglyceryl transferase [Desulfobotulus pelophilus]MCW7753612.1 prolipoprotein diacylglyceryl transferase [Desulfobotulus pelophilus]
MPSPLIWNTDPILFSIGPLAVRWYGFFFACAFICGMIWMQYLFRQEAKNADHLEPLLYRIMAGVIIGARLGHCLFYDPVFYLSNPLEILKVWEGGLASHGGIIGLFLALYIHSRKHPATPLPWLADHLMVAGCLGASLIRMGNFFNSELVGIPTTGSLGVIFTRVDLIPRHPVQLYESIAYAACSFFLFWAWKKGAGNIPWRLTSLSLIMAASARIFLETLKTQQTAFALPVHMGQLLSLPFLLCGLALFLYTRTYKVLPQPPSANHATRSKKKGNR